MKEQFLTKNKKTWSKWKWIWLQTTFKTYTVKKLNLHTQDMCLLTSQIDYVI